MTHTFADAKTRLIPHMSGYMMGDPSAAVNEALDELSQTRSWKRLRKVIRFTLTGEYFALPQDCGRLIRCAVDGRPVPVHGQDYDFLSAGPGDLDLISGGLAPLHGVQQLGLSPVMLPLTAAAGLAAFSATPPADPLVIRARLASGDVKTVSVSVTAGDPSAAAAASEEVAEILSVVLPPGCEAYVSLYSISAGALSLVSRMHPSVRVPEFALYRVPGVSAGRAQGYRMLAEVGLRFLPLVADDDPIPFPSLRPVQHMLQAFAAEDTGESKAADSYRARAELALMRREDVENERQSMQILNPLFEGSDGESCDFWEGV